MSAIHASARRLAAELSAVRGSLAPIDEDAPRVLAAALLSTVAEPGDGTLGRVVDAIGEVAAADAILTRTPAAHVAAMVRERGDAIDDAECADGLERWMPRADHGAFVRLLAQAARVDASLVTRADAAWPSALDDLGAHAPRALWVRGRLDLLASQPSIALVGARAATSYGERVAIEAAGGLVDRGFAIVSGGAYGIDGMAHRSALASGGGTVAFLAGGVDRFYPLGHESLLTRIAESGAVVSELPCGAAPTKWRFLQRNRLIAAASVATVVLEAGTRSGSLNTAGHAAALGRPLGAVPGPVTSAASAGCHRLLREYDAMCVTDAADMAELAGDDRAARRAIERRTVPALAHEHARPGGSRAGQTGGTDGESPPVPLALDLFDAPPVDRGTTFADHGDGRRILDAIGTRGAPALDQLVERSGLPSGQLMAGLGRLEASGAIVRRGGGWAAAPSGVSR